MTADAIAKVVRDLARDTFAVERRIWDQANHYQLRAINEQMIGLENYPVIDVSSIHDSYKDNDKGWALYEDTVARPVFDRCTYAYVNQYGNVEVMHVRAMDRPAEGWGPEENWESNVGHVIRWDDVRWVSSVAFYIGGYSTTSNRHLPTTGPMHFLALAIYEDGTLADIHWSQLREDVELTFWDQQMTVMLMAMTILNCRNVEIREPVRDRKLARRIARYGDTTISEIHVTRLGKYTRSDGPKRLGDGVPLGPVRGHVARYGPKYGRGLLFGKYEGEFWVPGHLRGRADLGEVERSYMVE